MKQDVSPREEKSPCNPDEIIEGRPKWPKFKQLKKRKHDKDERTVKEEFDFDRLNPHRVTIFDLDDNLDNDKGQYQKVALKMLADLQVDTFVTLGDMRLTPTRTAREPKAGPYGGNCRPKPSTTDWDRRTNTQPLGSAGNYLSTYIYCTYDCSIYVSGALTNVVIIPDV